MKIPIPFCGPTYAARSLNISAQETINLFPELADDGKIVLAMHGTPGKSVYADFGNMPIRGLHITSDGTKLWVVTGNEFREVLNDGTDTVKGYLTTSNGPVYIDDNGTHLLIVDGSDTGYVYTLATGAWDANLTGTDADFIGGDSCCFVDGYFFVNQPDSDIIQSCTAPNGTAPTSWEALDVFSTKGDPDKLVRVAKHGRELWAFGGFSTEIFWNSGNPTAFPFSRIEGGVLDVGLGARASLSVVDNSFLFLAKTKNGDRFVVQTQGFSYARISTHAIEYEIGKMAAVEDAEAYSYTEEGHTFYVLTFPIGGMTFVYDLATQMWHKRQSAGLNRDRARWHVFFLGRHIVGDSLTGKLGVQSLDVFTEYGHTLRRVRRTQHSKKDMRRVVYNELEIEMEYGAGLNEGQGEDPQAMLRWSDDGGHIWSNERWASIGKMGAYGGRVRFVQLGSGRDRVWELTISDPVKVTILGATIDAEVLAS